MEQDEYYHDSIEYEDHNLEEHDDMSDIDQQELEIRLYSEIHYQTDPDNKEFKDDIHVEQVIHDGKQNVVSTNENIDRSQNLVLSKETELNQSDPDSKIADASTTPAKNEKNNVVFCNPTVENDNFIIMDRLKTLKDKQPDKKKELSRKESVVVEMDKESDHSESNISLDCDSDGISVSGDDILVEDVQLHIDKPVQKGPVRTKEIDIEHQDTTLEDIHNTMPDTGWSIIPEDCKSTKYNVNRYYKPLNVRCHNCNERGHLSKVCPQPKKIVPCTLCGDESHRMRTCPNAYCRNCLNPGHNYQVCEEPRRKHWQVCHTCEMQGHRFFECPNRWRQFHLTVDGKNFRWGNNEENSRVYCSNCGREGHFHHDCIQELMDKHNRQTWPFITSYQLARECRIYQQKTKQFEQQLKQEHEEERNIEPKRKKFKRSSSESNFLNSDKYTYDNTPETSQRDIHLRIGEEINTHQHFIDCHDNVKRKSKSGKRKRGQGHKGSNKHKKKESDAATVNINVNKNHSFIQSAIEANEDKKKKAFKKKKTKNAEQNCDTLVNEEQFNEQLKKLKNTVENKLFGTSERSRGNFAQNAIKLDLLGNKAELSNLVVIEGIDDKSAKVAKKKKNKRKKKKGAEKVVVPEGIQRNKNVHSQQQVNTKGVEQNSNKGKKKKRKQKKNQETFSSNRGFVSSYKRSHYHNNY